MKNRVGIDIHELLILESQRFPKLLETIIESLVVYHTHFVILVFHFLDLVTTYCFGGKSLGNYVAAGFVDALLL
jgi:hypothetical protein